MRVQSRKCYVSFKKFIKEDDCDIHECSLWLFSIYESIEYNRQHFMWRFYHHKPITQLTLSWIKRRQYIIQLNSLTPPRIPQYKLILKVGSPTLKSTKTVQRYKTQSSHFKKTFYRMYHINWQQNWWECFYTKNSHAPSELPF